MDHVPESTMTVCLASCRFPLCLLSLASRLSPCLSRLLIMFLALTPRLVLPRGSPMFDGPRTRPHLSLVFRRPGIARHLCVCPVSSFPYILCLGGVSVCCHCAILGLVISLLPGHCALRVVRLVTLHLSRLVLLLSCIPVYVLSFILDSMLSDGHS